MEAYSDTYERYKKFCEDRGCPVMSFEDWMHAGDPRPTPVDQEIAKLLSTLD